MRWDKATYEAYQAKRAAAGKRMQLQEHQDGHNQTKAKADNQPKEAEAIGPDHKGFRVSVTFRIADKRDRDLDGMLSSVLDCLIDAVGRSLQVDKAGLRKLAKGEERRRGL